MKVVIFTSNALRHKFFANTIADNVDETLVISECRENDQINKSYGENDSIICLSSVVRFLILAYFLIEASISRCF